LQQYETKATSKRTAIQTHIVLPTPSELASLEPILLANSIQTLKHAKILLGVRVAEFRHPSQLGIEKDSTNKKYKQT
jgi:hypothetical protein